jgi:hypothetical protein
VVNDLGVMKLILNLWKDDGSDVLKYMQIGKVKDAVVNLIFHLVMENYKGFWYWKHVTEEIIQSIKNCFFWWYRWK